MTYSISIDFGTTKTLVAYPSGNGDRPEIAHLGRERNSLPTSAFYGEGGAWEFGDDADDYACDAAMADHYVSKFKLKLGSTRPVLQIFSSEAFSSFNARDVATEYLRYIRTTCEKEVFNGHSVKEAVITHPVHFTPAQLADLRYAAEQAGFAAVKLMSEPEAAGLAFCRLCPKDVFNGTALVVDWGGGTLDLALVSREDGRVKVHDKYVAGSDTIGGIVFDELLWKHVVERLQQEHGMSPAEDRKDLIRLQKKKIMAVKEKLSRTETAMLSISGNRGAYPTLKITRAELENAIQPYVQAGIEGVHDLLGRIREQSLRPTQVLLIGGSSQIPLISKLIQETTGLPCRRWQYSHEAVALGAIVADTRKEASSTVAIEKDTPDTPVVTPKNVTEAPSPQTSIPSAEVEAPQFFSIHASSQTISPPVDRINTSSAELLTTVSTGGAPTPRKTSDLTDASAILKEKKLGIPPKAFSAYPGTNKSQKYNLINACIGCLTTRFAMFDGRASRAEYWWASLGLFIIQLFLEVIPVIGQLASIALIVPTWALNWRRGHDAGVPGWHMLIPIYNLYLACVPSKGANEYGAGPLPPVS